ncbi:MAG TPA: SDR family oxidoreductase [Caldimonas sp.]|jgi:2-keto-3-deoxy-L-fuconate dehydrogenase
MRLQGKKALVTAAGQGIGRASALALAAAGAEVLATDIDTGLLDRYAGVPRIRTARLDVLDRGAIDALFATLPPLDLLFNCAGIVHDGSALEATDDELELAFRLNVRSQLWTIRAALPAMLANGGGSIVNMASIASSIKGLPNRCVYGLTKAAVIGITKSVAADYVRQGIRCNALCPGTVDTPSLAGRIAAAADPAAARRAFVDRQPMGRLAQADEIAPMVVYLASDESRFATGQAFCVDGGMTI